MKKGWKAQSRPPREFCRKKHRRVPAVVPLSLNDANWYHVPEIPVIIPKKGMAKLGSSGAVGRWSYRPVGRPHHVNRGNVQAQEI